MRFRRSRVLHRATAVLVGSAFGILSACESRPLAITKFGPLESSDQVGTNSDVGVGVEVTNPGNAPLEFRWQAQRGRIEMAVTKTPVNIYRAPPSAGLDTLNVTVVAGDEAINRAIQLTVVESGAASRDPRPAATATQASTQSKPLPLNVQLVTAAFEAFNAGMFDAAIAAADKCIAEFRSAADDQQTELERAKVSRPPTGRVTDAQRRVIEERGLLNDVATCFWIKGRAAQNLSRLDVAREAFGAAAKYTYARCWDPAGFFWSPPDDARNRLVALK